MTRTTKFLPHLPFVLGDIVDRLCVPNMKTANQRQLQQPFEQSCGSEDAMDKPIVDQSKRNTAESAYTDLQPRVIVKVDSKKKGG